MPLTPEDVHNKRFTSVRFKNGYDEEEVDAFLDEVEAELRRLLSENTELRTSGPAPAAAPVAAAAPAAAAPPAEQPNEAALRTLLLAQRTADDAIAQAKQEAEQIVVTAKGRAASIESEAQQQHAAAMAELQRQRQTLEVQIEELRSFEREYRTRLKAYLEGQLRDLDSRTAAPAGGGAPARPPAAAAPAVSRPPGPPAPPGAPAAAAPASAGPPPAAAAAPGLPAALPPPTADIPRLAPPGGPVSPFSAAPPLVEDMDAGSDAPTGPPHDADVTEAVDGEESSR